MFFGSGKLPQSIYFMGVEHHYKVYIVFMGVEHHYKVYIVLMGVETHHKVYMYFSKRVENHHKKYIYSFCSVQYRDKLTAPLIARRLEREAEANVAVAVGPAPAGEGMPDATEVFGRGELQLAVLIETMRREGFELSVSPPRVLIREGEEGKKEEPWEEVTLEVPEQIAGALIEKLGRRRGELIAFDPAGNGMSRLVFEAPARALLGFQSEFRQETRGEGIMTRAFAKWGPYQPGTARPRKGALVSSAAGNTTSYSLAGLEPRGILFLGPGEPVYPGMIVGEHTRDNDLDVNPVKGKKLTNIRASGSDDLIKLAPPKIMALEEAVAWIQQDELLEVTPVNLRPRKRILDPSKRKTAARANR